MTITLAQIEAAAPGRLGRFDIACPSCGPSRSRLNRHRPTLRVWRERSNFATFNCKHCMVKGYARDKDAPPLDPVEAERLRIERDERDRRERARQLDKARWLWKFRAPTAGSLAERYLREARGYRGQLPGTLGFIPPRGHYPPAMIAAFGIPDELEPGVLSIADEAVTGIHLTRLTPDARKIPDNAKIMLGPSVGSPICLVPVNDLLGMAIAEGIEDALSAHAVTGLGAWAAGSASRLPALARILPDYVEAVTILVDADDAGRKFSSELARLLRERDTEVRMRYGC